MSKQNFKEKSIGIFNDLFKKFRALPRRKQILYVAIAVLVLVAVPSPSVDDAPFENNSLEVSKNQEVKDEKKDEQKEEPKPVADKEEKEEEIPFEELSFEEQVDMIANKYAPGSVMDVNTDHNEVNITLKMGDNFTNNLIVSGMRIRAYDIFKALQPLVEQNGINDVTVTYQTTFVDKYGNESIGNAGIIAIPTSELIKINFDNITHLDLDGVCSALYIHPSLSN